MFPSNLNENGQFIFYPWNVKVCLMGLFYLKTLFFFSFVYINVLTSKVILLNNEKYESNKLQKTSF